MKKILVIDDDSLVRHAYALTLENLGYEVKAVTSGQKSIDEIQRGSYDLVFLDLNMPGMNGIDTVRAIREIDGDIPVYIVSGFHNAYTEELNKLTEDGISYELASKPLNLKQIKEIVDNVFGNDDCPC